MLDWKDTLDLKKALGLDAWGRRDTPITPELIAEHFREVMASTPHSWVPEAILRYTVGEAETHLRSQFTHADILTAYENAITRAVSHWGIESPAAPIADVILKHIANDERLCSAVPPEYIYGRFQRVMNEENIEEAFYLFQSTVYSNAARAAFSPDDVRLLFLRAHMERRMFLVADLLETTQDDERSRSKITPAMFGHSFRECLRCIQDGGPYDNPPHYAYTAVRMLQLTIGDDRLRSGIKEDDIQNLMEFYQEIAESRHLEVWKVKAAKVDIEQIKAFTLQNPDETTVRSLFERFSAVAADRGEIMPYRRDAHAAAQSMHRYGILKAA